MGFKGGFYEDGVFDESAGVDLRVEMIGSEASGHGVGPKVVNWVAGGYLRSL